MIHVKLSTTLREHIPGYEPVQGLYAEHSEALTVEGLALRLGLPLSEIKVVMVNGRRSALDQPLADNDRVAFFPAVGGG